MEAVEFFYKTITHHLHSFLQHSQTINGFLGSSNPCHYNTIPFFSFPFSLKLFNPFHCTQLIDSFSFWKIQYGSNKLLEGQEQQKEFYGMAWKGTSSKENGGLVLINLFISI